MPPTALLVSWLFPPHGSVGAKRAYRFARHLPAHGWDVAVLCGREPPARFRDPTPLDLPDAVRVVRDYDPAWLTRAANALDARFSRPSRAPSPAAPTAPARPRPSPAALLSRALPTETIAVHLPHALSAATRLAGETRASVLWTTSYPYSSHLLGVALKRRLGVPFVADLRDPWTLNFVHDEKPAPTRAIERALEALVFAHADRVTVTTETLADAYRARYPRHAHKFAAIRNAFDPLPLPPRAPAARPVRLVHFGHVYGARTLADVLHALAHVRAARTLAPGEILLENYGRLSDEDRALAARLGLGDVLSQRDPLPYAEGLRALRDAHLLLLPAWGTERGPLFLPGKLYDYLLAGAPILAVGDNPELARILAHTRTGALVPPGDSAAIARAIAAAVDGTLPHAPDPRAVAQYAAPGATERLAALFREIARPPPP